MQPSSRRGFLGAGGAALFSVITARKAFAARSSEHKLQVLPNEEIGTIRPELHGQFAEHLGSCVYGGLWVGPKSPIPNINGHRKLAVEYLRALGVPVLRWPGGCFADDYHWRDGIGPAAHRPKTVNLHWGEYTEDNSFGTHEFVSLCRLIGAEPYFAGNVGTGSPTELRNWVEYCNYPAGSSLSDERARNGSPEPFRIKYWGVGNELWGCGGGLTGGDYATLYRNYSTFLQTMGDTKPFLIACGPSKDNAEWTQQFFAGLNKVRRLPEGYTMHYYSNGKDPATGFGVTNMNLQFASFALMEAAILHQRTLIDPFDAQKKVGLMVDEWGVWDRMVPEEEKTHGRLWQQIPARAGVATALGLNVFHRQADKLVMCNIAQMVNVLDSMLLTEGDKCIRTPAYYAFDLMKVHRGRAAVKTDAAQPEAVGLSVSASVARQGKEAAVTLVNPKHDEAMKVSCGIAGRSVAKAKARSLYHADLNACNTFDAPDTIVPRELAVTTRGTELSVELPPLSVTTIEVELA
ncbi:MAG TPA: alpha-L-arabinofuranosidase C-terminal domain-containing protein [Bryobacteraceae bacterium]|nr:alpha-L-arabinofuranosidase C-terminal domain-containing protein [Bryobacteraceae bacterium]